MKNTFTQFRGLLVITALVLAPTAMQDRSATTGYAAQTHTAPRSTLTDLRGIEELKTRFNRDAGKIRLVLLLSPT